VTSPVAFTSSQLAALTGALPTLRALGRGTTVTETARQQGVSQPALSRMITRLESDLAIPLIRKHGRGIALTEEGAILAGAAEQALTVFESSLEAVMSTRDSRPVRLGTLRSLSGHLAPLIADAKTRVNLSVSEGSADALLSLLAASELDAAIVGPRPTSDKFTWSFLGNQPFHLVVPLDHPLAGLREVELTGLGDEPFVAMDEQYTTRQFADELCQEADIDPVVAVESDNSHTLRSFVEAGLGLCILPAAMAEAPGVSSVPIVRPDSSTATREIGLVRISGRQLPPHVRTILLNLTSTFSQVRLGGRS
jgi:DNA-binding transcriptional LysR family regulator